MSGPNKARGAPQARQGHCGRQGRREDLGRRGHRVLPHTADVILQAWGPDLSTCLEDAVAALVGTYLEDTLGSPAADQPLMTARSSAAERHLSLPPAPAESWLLSLLDEVIFTLDTEEGVPARATVVSNATGGLDVTIALARRDEVVPTGAVPKAVSRSELEIVVWPDRACCQFLVDV